LPECLAKISFSIWLVIVAPLLSLGQGTYVLVVWAAPVDLDNPTTYSHVQTTEIPTLILIKAEIAYKKPHYQQRNKMNVVLLKHCADCTKAFLLYSFNYTSILLKDLY
jgi:hypothetical protein